MEYEEEIIIEDNIPFRFYAFSNVAYVDHVLYAEVIVIEIGLN
jgi:hypothetical protein